MIISYSKLSGNYNINSSLTTIFLIISYSKLSGNYNRAGKCSHFSHIISYSKLSGNYNLSKLLSNTFLIISYSKLSGNYNGEKLIPTELLGDIKTKIAMKTVEKDTQAGTSKRRTNVVDTAEATFTLYLPSLDFLGKIFPEYYASSTAGGGAVTFGGKNVKVAEMPVNMHQKGAETDENDVHFFKATVNVDFELSQTTSDDPSVELH